MLAGQLLRDSWLHPFSSRPEPGTPDEEAYKNKDLFQQIPVRWPSADAKPEKGNARVGCEDTSHKQPSHELVSKSWANNLRQEQITEEVIAAPEEEGAKSKQGARQV